MSVIAGNVSHHPESASHIEELTVNDEIQLISDGDGLAVIGDRTAVEQFLASEKLPSKDLGLPRLARVLSTSSGGAQAGSEIAASSGRWVKLTEESAQSVKKYGLRQNSKTGVSTGVVEGKKGQVRGFVEFTKSPRSLLTNPALLAGAAGIMAQAALQQSMDEITDYLALIDEKVDDVLRAQKDAVIADMIGVDLVLEEAMALREHGGRVNEVTWSKAQATSATVARTQAYALRQLDAIAEKLEAESKVGSLADAVRDAQSKTHEWLAVLARCFQLQDAIAVLELDRVLDAVPEDLDAHRLGLKAARQKRLNTISRSTGHLMARMNTAASLANTKVLFHPRESPAIVRSTNHVAVAIEDFQERIGIERGKQSSEIRQWSHAVSDVRSKALENGAGGVDAARRFRVESFERAKSARNIVSGRITERTRRRRERGDDNPP